MTERKNSAEQVMEEFMGKGGILVGKDEWDKILLWVYPAFESYLKKNPDFNGYSCDFARMVWNAANEHCVGFTEKKGKGRVFIQKYDKIYVRVDENNEFVALHEENGEFKETTARPSEIIAYLTMKVHAKKITFEEAWKSYVYRRIIKAE